MDEKITQDVVLLNSGGIDSRVSAALAQSHGYTVHSLFLNFNQPSLERAQEAAKRTADLYCVDHKVVKYDVDWGYYTPATGNFALPMHGLFLLLVGVQYAAASNIKIVLSGFDSRTYTSKIINQLHDFMSLNTFRPMDIVFLAPFKDETEDTALKEHVSQLKVPLEDTVSCGHHTPCGECLACKRRIALELPLA